MLGIVILGLLLIDDGLGGGADTPHAVVVRSPAQVAAFQRVTICPSTGKTGHCPGYVVDHIIALTCFGEDLPSNMQYQTIAEAHAKDLWERPCHHFSDAE